jgi:hypothetical protein
MFVSLSPNLVFNLNFKTFSSLPLNVIASNAIGNDAITLRGKLEKVLKFRLKTRFGDKDTNILMGAL